MATAVAADESSFVADVSYAVPIEAPEKVHDALTALGRTEDVRLSPNGKRLAIAGFTRATIAVVDIEIARRANRPRVSVTDIELLSAPTLADPHGVDWLDDETLVVGNRGGGITVVDVESATSARHDSPGLLDGPGSVAARPVGDGRHELLVCNNWADTITRHVIGRDGGLAAGDVALGRWLDLPDGLALSADGRWLAVSNHNTHCVLVFAYDSPHERGDPAAILRGVRYPHGLRFDGAGRNLVVADAGAPHVHVYSVDGDWHGVAYPPATVAVIDRETFARGHRIPQEGGPKGIELDPRTNILLVTSELAPLAAFDLSAVLERARDFAPAGEVLLDAELEALTTAANAKAAAARDRAELRAIMATKAWRLTALPRRGYGALRGLARRRSTLSSSTSSATSSGAAATARSDRSA